MKGISAIIVIVLLLMIVVAMGGMLYLFSSNMFTTTSTATQQSINQTTRGMLANMKIESISGNRVYVRNVGQTPLTNFEIYIGDSIIESEVDKTILLPGDVATIKIPKIETSPGVWEVPAGNIKVTTAESPLITYNNYQGYSSDTTLTILTPDASLFNFTTPLSGFRVTATAYDDDSLNEIIYCSIIHRRTDDWYGLGYYYYKNVTYDPLTGNCSGDVTTFDINPIISYNADSPYGYNEHSLILDNNYIYALADDSYIFKIFPENVTVAASQDVGTGSQARGLSHDAEFIYFGDYNSNLTKVRKSDLQRNLTIRLSSASQPTYATAVDDVGVYYGNNQYNITKVNKTNFAQRLWSVDYTTGVVYDIDVDSEYLYAVDSRGNITKINKTSVGTAQKIWSVRPLNATTPKYSITIEGNDLWVGDAKSTLWQIDKVTGNIIGYTNYSNYLPIGPITEIFYDSNFFYISQTYNSVVLKVNKATKAPEDLFYLCSGANGLACDMNYCYSADNCALITKFYNTIPVNNYNSGESIAAIIIFFDIYGNSVSTNEAYNVIP